MSLRTWMAPLIFLSACSPEVSVPPGSQEGSQAKSAAATPSAPQPAPDHAQETPVPLPGPVVAIPGGVSPVVPLPPLPTPVPYFPGTAVDKVGVNYRDQGAQGGGRYSDVVLCFRGQIKVDSTSIISTAVQMVSASTYTIASCAHTILVTVVHPDGTKEPDASFSSRSAKVPDVAMNVGDKLEVVMMSSSAACNPGVRKPMSDPDHCSVVAGVCGAPP